VPQSRSATSQASGAAVSSLRDAALDQVPVMKRPPAAAQVNRRRRHAGELDIEETKASRPSKYRSDEERTERTAAKREQSRLNQRRSRVRKNSLYDSVISDRNDSPADVQHTLVHVPYEWAELAPASPGHRPHDAVDDIWEALKTVAKAPVLNAEDMTSSGSCTKS